MWAWKSHGKSAGEAPPSVLSPRMLAFLADAEDRATVARFAGSQGWNLTLADTLDSDPSAQVEANTAVVVLDADLTCGDWRSAIRRLAQRAIPPCIVLASYVSDDYLFEEMVKQGGFDVIAKPLEKDELQRIARSALAFWKNKVRRSSLADDSLSHGIKNQFGH